MEGKLLTIDDVAEWLGLSRQWVHDHATRRAPRLPVVRLGSDRRAVLRFRREDIDAFIRKHLVADSQEAGS